MDLPLKHFKKSKPSPFIFTPISSAIWKQSILGYMIDCLHLIKKKPPPYRNSLAKRKNIPLHPTKKILALLCVLIVIALFSGLELI